MADADVPILCFHPPTPPSPTKQMLFAPPTPPTTPPRQRPPPPSLEPDGKRLPPAQDTDCSAPSDALDNTEVDDDSDAPLDSPPLVLSKLSDACSSGPSALRLGVSEEDCGDSSCPTPIDVPTSPWPSVPSTPLAVARESWLGAQSRRASASARGEFKLPKHEQDWAAAETYVASLEDSLMALYRCLEEMDIAASSGEEVEGQ